LLMRLLERLLEMEQKVLIIDEMVMEVLRHENNLKKKIELLYFFIIYVHRAFI
jgi:hypothetical protein